MRGPSVNVHRAAAVLLSTLLLGAGVTVAVSAATATDPIKLCSNNLNGIVKVAKNDQCPRGTTAFFVADNSDVQALAGRMDAAEGGLAAQANRISALEGQVASLAQAVEDSKPPTLILKTVDAGARYHLTIVGTKLRPGSKVRLHLVAGGNSWSVEMEPTVGDDGTYEATDFIDCSYLHVYATGTTVDGLSITSRVIDGPTCP